MGKKIQGKKRTKERGLLLDICILRAGIISFRGSPFSHFAIRVTWKRLNPRQEGDVARPAPLTATKTPNISRQCNLHTLAVKLPTSNRWLWPRLVYLLWESQQYLFSRSPSPPLLSAYAATCWPYLSFHRLDLSSSFQFNVAHGHREIQPSSISIFIRFPDHLPTLGRHFFFSPPRSMFQFLDPRLDILTVALTPPTSNRNRKLHFFSFCRLSEGFRFLLPETIYKTQRMRIWNGGEHDFYDHSYVNQFENISTISSVTSWIYIFRTLLKRLMSHVFLWKRKVDRVAICKGRNASIERSSQNWRGSFGWETVYVRVYEHWRDSFAW